MHNYNNQQTKQLQTAGFGIRLLATLIDNLILGIALAPIFSLLLGPGLSNAELQHILQTEGIAGIIQPDEIIIQQTILLIIIAFCWIKFAGTPGKRLLKLKVIDAQTGKNINIFQSIIRFLGYFISSFFMGIGFVWIIFDKQNQGWHDKLAGTVVIIDNGQTRETSDTQKQEDETFVA